MDKKRDSNHERVMKAVVAFLLAAISRLKMFTDRTDDLKVVVDEEITKAVKSFYSTLEEWVKEKLSGEVFGTCRSMFYEMNSKEELQVKYFTDQW